MQPRQASHSILPIPRFQVVKTGPSSVMTLEKELGTITALRAAFRCVCFDIDRKRKAKLGLSPLAKVQVFGR